MRRHQYHIHLPGLLSYILSSSSSTARLTISFAYRLSPFRSFFVKYDANISMSDHKQGTELSNLMPTGIPASGTQGAGLDQAAPMEGQDNDIEKAGGAVHALIPKIVVTAASPGPDLAGVPGEMKPGFFGKLKQSLKIQLQKPVLFWKKTDKRTMLTVSSCVVTVMMLCAMIPLAVVAVHGKFCHKPAHFYCAPPDFFFDFLLQRTRLLPRWLALSSGSPSPFPSHPFTQSPFSNVTVFRRTSLVTARLCL